MNKRFLLWIIIIFLFISGSITVAYSQEVEHNYKVGPQFTTCDSLNIQDLESEQAIDEIRSAIFRFKQTFKLTRREGFKGAEFYSCDGDDGYLIIKYTEKTFLYLNVEKENWNKLRTSSDPEGYYLEIKNGLTKID